MSAGEARAAGGPGTALVVGAGVGGLCAAARLANAGWQVTLLERLRQVGGRWSSRDVDGFTLPTGAFLIALDDPLAETFAELNVDFPVRPIEERTVYLVGGSLVGTGERGGLRALVEASAERDGSDPQQMMQVVRAAISGAVAATEQPLPVWLEAQGAGPVVRAAFHSITQAWMALNAGEVRADAFFDYLRAQSGRGHHGIPPGGSEQLADNLADFVRQHGGRVQLDARVTELTATGGRVDGVVLRDGTHLSAEVVVSDLGVTATAALLPRELAAHLPAETEVSAAPGITCYIASREPFYEHPAVVTVGTRCVCLVTTPTLVAPELAPAGWHFTETISTFVSSTDDSDAKGELALHLADVDELLPGWRERGRLLKRQTYRGAWPVYRAWPGHDSQDRLPVPGLALVGDSVKPAGFAGTGASAESARLVVEGILAGLHGRPAVS
jgi:phytoene dehydrogenase-like protein